MELEKKVENYFSGITVKKNLARSFPSVPRFVSEFLIMGVIKEDGTVEEQDLQKIDKFISNYRPESKEYEVWKNKFVETNENKLIEIFRVEVDLSKNPPLRKCIIPFLKKESPIRIRDAIVENYEALLCEGLWGLGTIRHSSQKKTPDFKTNLELVEFTPFELTNFSFEQFLQGYEHFTLEERVDLLINTIGLNPNFYSNFYQKLLLLCRLVPIVERNTNIIELGPKETGKSFLMENISPNVYNIQPSEISPATLFYHGTTKQMGLLGLKDVLVFDEIGDVPLGSNSKDIPSKLRGFLSNGKFKKGDKVIYSNCSLYLMGNVKCDENLIPKSPRYILALDKYWHDSAMLDRFGGLIYGWKLKKLTADAISKSYGIAADFFHRILTELRKKSFRINIEKRVILKNFEKETTIRNRNAVFSITSGLLKLLYPNEKYTIEGLKLALDLAIKLRTQLYSQLKHLDDEYKKEINLNYEIIRD